MLNKRLIEEAIDLVLDFNINNNYCINISLYEIINRIENWYNNTSITTPEMLAAVALEGDYFPEADWDYCLEMKEFYYPTIPVEFSNEINIEDIKISNDTYIWSTLKEVR